MVDTAMLQEYMDKSGKKKQFLAEKLGLSRAGFRNKCIGATDFTSREISVLCEELGVTRLTDKERIFFAPDVAENGDKGE